MFVCKVMSIFQIAGAAIRAEAAEERKESDVPPKKTKVTVCLCVKNSVGWGGSKKRQKSEVDIHD